MREDVVAAVGTLFKLAAVVVLSIVAVGWTWAARRRERFPLRRQRRFGSLRRHRRDFGTKKRRERDGNDDDDINDDERWEEEEEKERPTVGVVLPVKGFSTAKRENWRTQLKTSYDGTVVFVFVVDKDTDEAKEAAERLIAEWQEEEEENVSQECRFLDDSTTGDRNSRRRRRRRSARVVVSGSAETCSQKIRQQLRGVEELGALADNDDDDDHDYDGRRRSSSSRSRSRCPSRVDDDKRNEIKYVLFLDDDVMLYPSTIGSLVRAMEKDEKETGGNALLATGYPLDFVGNASGSSKSASCFANYMTMVYHLVLLIPFSHGKYTKNVWGGCMLFRLDEFLANACKVKEAYETGGYSDDLIVAAAADREKRSILCPGDALFPMPLNPKQTVRDFVNYFHRQIFVNDTYSDRHMKFINHGMLLAMFLSSLCLTVGTFASALDIIFWLFNSREWLQTNSSIATTKTNVPSLAFAVFFAHFLAVTRAKKMYASCVSLCERTATSAAQTTTPQIKTRRNSASKSIEPNAGRIARSGFNRTDWFKVWLAVCVVYAIAPLQCAYIFFVSDEVVWSGIRYRKRRGKVLRVD